jgi:hypothetical protein
MDSVSTGNPSQATGRPATGRPATGSISEHRTKPGEVTRTPRFYVNGRRERVALGVVTRDEAEAALRHNLADVERGEWKPPEPPPESPGATPTFHDYADDWWSLQEPASPRRRRPTTSGVWNAT